MDYQISNINFGAKTIYKINVKKTLQKGYELAKADFAEISPSSNNDFSFIKDLFEKWRLTNSFDKCIANIKIYFQNDFFGYQDPMYKYFVLKLASKRGKLPNKTCAVAAVIPNNETLEISQLQSASSIITPGESIPKVKGAGELTILGIIKWAKENGFKRIELVSVVDSFYDKLGFKRIKYDKGIPLGNPTHYLDSEMFDGFIHRIENKYKTN